MSRWWWLFVPALCALAATANAEDEPPPARKIGSISFAIVGDKDVEVALGPIDSARVIIYLHGTCGDPYAFQSWIDAAVAHATLISLRGDEACKKNTSRSQWSWDSKKNARRIDVAIAAVQKLRESMVDSVEVTPLDKDDVTLIGYSQGAHRAEVLAHRFPKRFKRVALIGMAKQPDAGRLHHTERVLLMAGGWDARTHIYEGYQEMRRTKKDAVRYLELPKARHGEYGPKAQETMADALGWLFEAKLP